MLKKLKEYAQLIPRVIPNLDKFVEGISNDIKLNHGTLPPEDQEIILERRLICEGCPFLSKNATTSQEYFDLTKSHYSSSRTDIHCTMCGCPENTKTASLESNCGIEYYNSKNPDNQLPLKWTKKQST